MFSKQEVTTFSKVGIPVTSNYKASSMLAVVVVVVCFHDLKFGLSSQVKVASCGWCSSEMPPSKQVNGHSFTICLIVWCSSRSGEAI